jgi:hypothetical protein
MTKQAPVIGLSPGEREYIRRDLDMFFSTLPTVAEVNRAGFAGGCLV